MESFVSQFKEFLQPMAEISAGLLEMIGIIIIIIGSCRALIKLFQALLKKRPFHVVIDLGKALSFTLI